MSEATGAPLDLVVITSEDDLGRGQLGTGIDRRAPHRKVSAGVVLANSTRRDEGHVWVGSGEIFDVTRTTDPGRKNLDRGGTRIVCVGYFGWGESSKEDRYAGALAHLDELRPASGRDDELSTRLDRGGCLVPGENGARTDDRVTGGSLLDDVEYVGDCESEFDTPDTTARECVRECSGILDCRRSHDCGHSVFAQHGKGAHVIEANSTNGGSNENDDI